jgi:ATP-binding cassette subfamily G (WHITE) protein 2 (SNQ2)
LGIIIALSLGFFITLLVFTEFNTSIAGEMTTVLFKRGSNTKAIMPAGSSDEETLQPEEESTLDMTVGNRTETSIYNNRYLFLAAH